MTLPEFAEVLATAYPNTYHYHAVNAEGDYAVWQEYGGKRQVGGPLLVRKIQVDLFTKIEFDPALGRIEAALDEAGVVRDATETFYELEDGYIRHVLLCEVVDSNHAQRERKE